MWCYQMGHVVLTDRTRGVIRRDMGCHQTGHGVLSEGTCDVIGRDTWCCQRDMWCHQTGHVVLSDGTCSVIRRDMWCYRTGHVVSSNGTCGVIERDVWCYRTGHVVSSDGTRGVIRQDIWFHRTGHVVSSDRIFGVIGRGTWCHQTGARVGTVGWVTALQAARSRVLFPVVSLQFFSHVILLAALCFQTEMSTRNISWGLRRPVRRADSLTTFMCALSWNLFSEFSFTLTTLQCFWECRCLAMHWSVRFQSFSNFEVFRLLRCYAVQVSPIQSSPVLSSRKWSALNFNMGPVCFLETSVSSCLRTPHVTFQNREDANYAAAEAWNLTLNYLVHQWRAAMRGTKEIRTNFECLQYFALSGGPLSGLTACFALSFTYSYPDCNYMVIQTEIYWTLLRHLLIN
jgi:hypothetical protein